MLAHLNTSLFKKILWQGTVNGFYQPVFLTTYIAIVHYQIDSRLTLFLQLLGNYFYPVIISSLVENPCQDPDKILAGS